MPVGESAIRKGNDQQEQAEKMRRKRGNNEGSIYPAQEGRQEGQLQGNLLCPHSRRTQAPLRYGKDKGGGSAEARKGDGGSGRRARPRCRKPHGIRVATGPRMPVKRLSNMLRWARIDQVLSS